MEVEARGMEEGIRWIEELGKMESDLEITVKAIMSNEMQFYNEASHIFKFCHQKLQQRNDGKSRQEASKLCRSPFG